MKHSFFRPRTIAVIGVSQDPNKLGHQIFANILKDFIGEVYPVNPKGGNVLGHRVYETTSALPGSVDMAVIVIPAPYVIDAVRACGEKRIMHVVIISAGFGELGEEGRQREQDLASIAASYGMRILGPNCLGFLVPQLGLNASFAPALPQKGNVALVSQSGAMAVALMDWASQTSVGFSFCVSVGNKIDVDETDILSLLLTDTSTEVVLLYLESIESGSAFMEIIGKVAAKKPVVLMKAGKSVQGQEMVASHTGRIAKEHDVFEAYVRERGVIMADSIEEFFDYAEFLSRYPRMAGNRLGVVTNAGGPGVLTTDAIDGTELVLVHPSEKLQKQLHSFLPTAASTHNPIDILGDAQSGMYDKTLRSLLASKEIDGCIVLLTPQSVTDVEGVASVIVTLKKKFKKLPIVSSFMGGVAVESGSRLLEMHDGVHFEFPHRAVRVLDGVWQAQQQRKPWHLPHSPHTSSGFQKDTVLPMEDVIAFGKDIGIGMPWTMQVSTKKEIDQCEHLPFPLVVKIDNAHVLHKSEQQGVVMDITSKKELWSVVKSFKERLNLPYVVVQQQVLEEGQEVFAGFKRTSFGGCMVLGVGGIFAEVMEKPMIIPAPFTPKKVFQYLNGHVLGLLLQGYRGKTPFAVNSLVDSLCSVGNYFLRCTDIQQIDLNPVIVSAERTSFVDIKIIT